MSKTFLVMVCPDGCGHPYHHGVDCELAAAERALYAADQARIVAGYPDLANALLAQPQVPRTFRP